MSKKKFPRKQERARLFKLLRQAYLSENHAELQLLRRRDQKSTEALLETALSLLKSRAQVSREPLPVSGSGTTTTTFPSRYDSSITTVEPRREDHEGFAPKPKATVEAINQHAQRREENKLGTNWWHQRADELKGQVETLITQNTQLRQQIVGFDKAWQEKEKVFNTQCNTLRQQYQEQLQLAGSYQLQLNKLKEQVGSEGSGSGYNQTYVLSLQESLQQRDNTIATLRQRIEQLEQSPPTHVEVKFGPTERTNYETKLQELRTQLDQVNATQLNGASGDVVELNRQVEHWKSQAQAEAQRALAAESRLYGADKLPNAPVPTNPVVEMKA